MTMKNGAQTVEKIPGRKIILSSAVGKTNIDELRWLTETILSETKLWKNTGWAYVSRFRFRRRRTGYYDQEICRCWLQGFWICRREVYHVKNSSTEKYRALPNRSCRRTLCNSGRGSGLVKKRNSYLIYIIYKKTQAFARVFLFISHSSPPSNYPPSYTHAC